jgi:hypothetical protein
MEPWPRNWRGTDDDIPICEGIVAVMKPFIEHLCAHGFTHKTVRTHLDNCWVIGGEIIRDISRNKCRKLDPRKLVLDAIMDDGAPLAYHFDEQAQRSLDATAKKLHSFLTGNDQS